MLAQRAFPAFKEKKGKTSNYSRIPLHLFPALIFTPPKTIFFFKGPDILHLSPILNTQPPAKVNDDLENHWVRSSQTSSAPDRLSSHRLSHRLEEAKALPDLKFKNAVSDPQVAPDFHLCLIYWWTAPCQWPYRDTPKLSPDAPRTLRTINTHSRRLPQWRLT